MNVEEQYEQGYNLKIQFVDCSLVYSSQPLLTELVWGYLLRIGALLKMTQEASLFGDDIPPNLKIPFILT